jgi:hypothetical protein
MVNHNDFVFRLMYHENCLFDAVFSNVPNSISALLMSSVLSECMPMMSALPLDDTTNITNEIAKQFNITDDKDSQEVVNSAIFFILFLDMVQVQMGAGLDTREFNKLLALTKHIDLMYARSPRIGRIRLFPKTPHPAKYVLSYQTDTMMFDASGIFQKQAVQNGEFHRYNGDLKKLNIAEYLNFCGWADLTLGGRKIAFVDDVEPKVYIPYC